MNDQQAFIFENSMPVTECGCWVWLGYTTPRGGYGIFKRNDVNIRAHRYSYRAFHGDIPDDLLVMHSCDIPSCVNPDHLSVGTPTDNARDRDQKRHGAIKLTDDMVRDILRSRIPQRTLAKNYGVNKRTIMDIKRRRAWRHVEI